jgi:cephalosporin hydroxylase
MTTLIQLINNDKTDKNTVHSYLPLYESLIKHKKNTCETIIEVGIKDGGSIKLWHDYFPNAKIYGCDIQDETTMWDEIKNNDRIKLFTSVNAYDPLFINQIKDVQFDIALDDGPHTLNSMIQFIRLYLPLMKEDGILIIEDIQDVEWLNILASVVPQEYKRNIKTYDLRGNKNRYDDIVFVIDKNMNKIKKINQVEPISINLDSNQNKIQGPGPNTTIPYNTPKMSDSIESTNDCCLLINTCKQYSSNIDKLILQIQLYNKVFPKENILIVSGQEDENSIDYIDGIKIVKVTYSGIHLTSAIYIQENVRNYLNINYWVLLPDTIKFGPNFFSLIFNYYSSMKKNNQYTLPFISPMVRPTMDMGIVHTKHIINMSNYLKKIKLNVINKENLLILKKQLVYDENTILGLKAICYQPSTKFNYIIENSPPTSFIINSNREFQMTVENNIQTVYLQNIDLYKYQQNFKGPETELIVSL